jgi:hypothetical protein
MAHKQITQALKRRAEKKHRRAQAKKAMVRRSAAHRHPTDWYPADSFGPSLPKLSAQIWDYAEPLTVAAADAAGQKRAAQIAIACWNAALLPEETRLESIRPLIRAFANGDARLEEGLFDILDMMVPRKQALFSNDHRFILNYSLTDTAEGVHLMVVSSPLDRSKAAAAFPA